MSLVMSSNQCLLGVFILVLCQGSKCSWDYSYPQYSPLLMSYSQGSRKWERCLLGSSHYIQNPITQLPGIFADKETIYTENIKVILLIANKSKRFVYLNEQVCREELVGMALTNHIHYWSSVNMRSF